MMIKVLSQANMLYTKYNVNLTRGLEKEYKILVIEYATTKNEK